MVSDSTSGESRIGACSLANLNLLLSLTTNMLNKDKVNSSLVEVLVLFFEGDTPRLVQRFDVLYWVYLIRSDASMNMYLSNLLDLLNLLKHSTCQAFSNSYLASCNSDIALLLEGESTTASILMSAFKLFKRP